ncbi:MAG: bactofilin family protein [Sandaracinobacteroides sp.]
MFSKSKQKPEPGSAGATPQARPLNGARPTFSVLGGDVTVTGNISATVDLHLEGRVEGDIACATLVQGKDSVIRGAVTAEVARLAGTVEGSISARELVIQASARITGDVAYESLTIEQGSQVDGRFSPRGKVAQQGAAPQAPVMQVVPSEPSDLLARA